MPAVVMTPRTRTELWEDIHRLADEIELPVHHAAIDAREQWNDVQARIAELEMTLAHVGPQTFAPVERELTAVDTALRRLRDDLEPTA
jgi:hypothetical protein